MQTRKELYDLADRLDRVIEPGAILTPDQARLCAEGLRRIADDEACFMTANEIANVAGKTWDDPAVMGAATSIALIYASSR